MGGAAAAARAAIAQPLQGAAVGGARGGCNSIDAWRGKGRGRVWLGVLQRSIGQKILSAA